jgi:hypothetical protein
MRRCAPSCAIFTRPGPKTDRQYVLRIVCFWVISRRLRRSPKPRLHADQRHPRARARLRIEGELICRNRHRAGAERHELVRRSGDDRERGRQRAVRGGERVGRVCDVERATPWHRAWSRADPCDLTDLADPFDFRRGAVLSGEGGANARG